MKRQAEEDTYITYSPDSTSDSIPSIKIPKIINVTLPGHITDSIVKESKEPPGYKKLHFHSYYNSSQ